MPPIKLVIAVPSAGRVDFAFAYSLASLVAGVAGGVKTRPTEALEVSLDGQVSSVIHSNREQLVRRAIDSGKTHLLFLDDDMSFNPAVLEILLGRRQPVVVVNYLIKEQDGADPKFVAVGLNGRRIVTRKESTGLQEMSYSGFGVSLFETRAFAATPQPWFLPHFVPESSCYTTEDNPCFERIRAAGFPCYVDHDASKLVEHMGRKAWKWDQWRPAAEPTDGPTAIPSRLSSASTRPEDGAPIPLVGLGERNGRH